MDTTRLEAFSDGVFAIAITLLVLNLAVPPVKTTPDLAHALGQAWPSYAAYVVSFLVIGIIWVNHHHVFTLIARVDRPLMFINLMLLLVVAVMPFPTALLATYIRHGSAASHLAAAIYSATMLCSALTFIGLWLWVTRKGAGLLHERMDPERARGARLRFGLGTFVYLGTVGLSFVNAFATLAIHFVIAMYYVFDQLPAGADPDVGRTP